MSQVAEIESDVVFRVEYSVRAAQIAVYGLLGIEKVIPAITPHDQSRRSQFDAVVNAFA